MARLLSERETILPQIGRTLRFLGSVSRKGGDDAQRCQVVPRVEKPNHLLMRATTVCTAIFQLGHGVILQIEDTIRTTVRREKSNIVARLLSTPSALRTCGPTQRRVGRHIGETHCRKLPPN